jgi:long-subunit fatty acid transport protein
MNRMPGTLLLRLGLAALSALAASEARAGGFTNPDMGTRRSAMFTVVAHPDDPTAVFANPAGLTDQAVDGPQLYVSLMGVIPRLRVKIYDQEGVLHPGDDSWYMPTRTYGISPFLGFVTNRLPVEGLAVGAAVYFPDFMGAFLPSDAPTRYDVIDAFVVTGYATAAAAWKYEKLFSIGAGLSALYTSQRQSKVFSLAVNLDPDKRFAPPDPTADLPMHLDGSAWTIAWNVGALVHLPAGVDLGVSFTSQASPDLTGNVQLDQPSATPGGPTQTILVHQTTNLEIPWNLRAGAWWELPWHKELRLGVEFLYWRYSVAQWQTTQLDPPLLGIVSSIVSALGYTDSWNYAFGVSYLLRPDLELMAGIQTDHSPVPAGKHQLVNASTDIWGIAGGARYTFSDRLRAGLSLLHNWFADIDQNVPTQPSLTTLPENFYAKGQNWEITADLSFGF